MSKGGRGRRRGLLGEEGEGVVRAGMGEGGCGGREVTANPLVWVRISVLAVDVELTLLLRR